MNYKECLGEFIGTFILVLIGCGTVALAVIYNFFHNLFEVALFWGLGVAIAIYTVRSFSPAHLNPAVSISMLFNGNLTARKLPLYILSQFLGAFTAATFVYLIFESGISHFEASNNIIRGVQQSHHSAMIFGEFFPNPAYEKSISATAFQAAILEGAGTFILITVIFSINHFQWISKKLSPLIIGATITLLICIIAPYTQAGLNPARDFAPRIFAWFAGWDSQAYPPESLSFFWVYIAGPILGGISAVLCRITYLRVKNSYKQKKVSL